MPRPRAFDEATAVLAAREAFRRTGYAGTSLSDLSEATGLGKGSLYNTFGDKGQIFDRTFADYCDEADAKTEQVFTDRAGLGAVVGYLGLITGNAVTDEEHLGCLITTSTAELAVSSPAVVDRASKTLHHAEDLLTGALTDARRTGEIGGDEDPRDLARLLIAVTRGIEALGKAGYAAGELRAIEASAARMLAT